MQAPRFRSVTSATTGGQPTLTLRAGAPAMPGSYQEALVIGAKTGIPVTFTGGVPGPHARRDCHLSGDPGNPGRHRRRQVLTESAGLRLVRDDRRSRYEVPGEATGRPTFVAAASRRSS